MNPESDSTVTTSNCRKAQLRKSLYQKCSSSQRDGKMKRMTTNGSTAKPNASYIALISMAIQSTPEQKMLLSEIYQWLSENFSYFNITDKSWRNSVRHNLSLNECFVKCGRSDNGKGNYWSIHPANMEDFSNGDFRRRRARRQVKICDEDLKSLCRFPVDRPVTPMLTLATCNNYVPMIRTQVTPMHFARWIHAEQGLENNLISDWSSLTSSQFQRWLATGHGLEDNKSI